MYHQSLSPLTMTEHPTPDRLAREEWAEIKTYPQLIDEVRTHMRRRVRELNAFLAQQNDALEELDDLTHVQVRVDRYLRWLRPPTRDHVSMTRDAVFDNISWLLGVARDVLPEDIEEAEQYVLQLKEEGESEDERAPYSAGLRRLQKLYREIHLFYQLMKK